MNCVYTFSTIGLYIILPPLSCICQSAVQHIFYHVRLGAVLLPVSVMLIYCSIGDKISYLVCICYLFLFVIFLSHDISFVKSDFVLLLLYFEFLLTDTPPQS